MKKIIIASLLLSGCAVTATSIKPADKAQAKLDPYSGPVCLLKTPMPPDVEYTKIGLVRASKRFYGLGSEMYPHLADQTRKAGGDAIIDVSSKQVIGLLSAVRPIAQGTAVKLADSKSFKCKDYDGEWY